MQVGIRLRYNESYPSEGARVVRQAIGQHSFRVERTRAVRARKQVPTTMRDRYSLRAQKGQKDPRQQPTAPAAADALRNTDDRPPTRAPMGPNGQPNGPNGPNGANRPRGGGGLGWITRLLVLFLLLILGYQLYVNLLVPNAGSNTVDLAYSDFIAQVNQSNVKTATIADDRNVTGTLNHSITYTEQGGTKVTSDQYHT